MTLDDYQDAAARTINMSLGPDDRLLDAASGLAEESGEILAHVRKNRFQRQAIDQDAMVLELGDALWCLATVAGALGVTLDEVARRNVEKLERRHPGRFEPPL